MSYNPLSSNYLNNFVFKTPAKVTAATTKTTAGSTKSKTTNQKIQYALANNQSQNGVKSIEISFCKQGSENTSKLIYTNQGYMFGLLKKMQKISGQSCILFPQGIIANCNVINGYLNGWTAICKKNVFYCLIHYNRGKIDGLQFTYDIKGQIMVKSIYKNGKLVSIKQGIADSPNSFNKLVKNNQLMELISNTLKGTFFYQNYPRVQSKLGNFYGQKDGKIPQGLGVLITQSQLFFGQFQRGLLSGYGSMSFENGDSYVGEVRKGLMEGVGNMIRNGNISYRYFEATLSKEEFNSLRKLCKFQEIDEIYNIFNPIVTFYEKLKQIYRSQQKDESLASFVQIQTVNDQQDEKTQKSNQSYNSDTSRKKQSNIKLDMISELLKTTTKNKQKITDKQIISKQQNAKQIEEGEEPESVQEKKQEGKPKKKRGGGGGVLNDYQWEQIIEELQGQQSVGKQDGFLVAKQEIREIDNNNSAQLKKNPINSRINLKTVVNSQIRSQQDNERLQNRMIGKLTKIK